MRSTAYSHPNKPSRILRLQYWVTEGSIMYWNMMIATTIIRRLSYMKDTTEEEQYLSTIEWCSWRKSTSPWVHWQSSSKLPHCAGVTLQNLRGAQNACRLGLSFQFSSIFSFLFFLLFPSRLKPVTVSSLSAAAKQQPTLVPQLDERLWMSSMP